MRIITFVADSTLSPFARVALDFCRTVKTIGHEPILAGLVRTRETPGTTELGAAADAEHIPFRLLQQRYKYDPGLVGQMEMMFRRLKPDLFLSHDSAGVVIGRLSRFRPRCITHYAHANANEAAPLEQRWIGRRLLRLCDVVVAQSDSRADELISRGVKKERLIRATGEDAWIGELLNRIRAEDRA